MFGCFRLDIAERLLLASGKAVPLTPKVFDLLVLLAQHPGELLEKDFILGALWPNTFVEEANLSVNVSTLRRALESAGGSHYIETVPKRGYRFAVEVQEQYTALAVGAIWAWQIQRKSDNYLVWAIPIVISVLSFLRRLAMNRYFQIVRAYLMKVEDTFGVKGWEHEERRWTIGSTEAIFHCIIILLSIAGLVMSPILVAR